MLIAPFMKREAVARIVSRVPKGVDLTCVTRWRLYEVAAGVSDPEVWTIVRDHGGRLLLRDDLHAKAYLFDDRCLVGSANLTGAALGWGTQANLEVLLEVPCAALEVVALETALREQTVEVDESMFEAVVEAAAACQLGLPEGASLAEPFGSPASNGWLPTLRSPEVLFDAYAGHSENLTRATKDTARDDLRVLALPPRLDRRAFERAVAIALLQIPLIAGIDRLLATPRRFGEVRDYLAKRGDDANRDWDSAWQTLMRWLRYFMPDRYVLSVPHISEVMIRRDALQRMLNGS
jgi:hypothetical protein